MKALPLLLALALSACSGADDGGAALPDGAQPLAADGSPLRPLPEGEPGPEGEDPPCSAFAPQATCTRVGDVVWVLQADGGAWQLTGWSVDDERGRWVPGLQGSGGGMAPTVSEADLPGAEQPEALVVYGGGFDVVAVQEGGRPRVVAHGEGQASVEGDEVVAGDRRVRSVDGRWVSVPR